MGFDRLMRKPSAWLPVAMSLAALVLVIVHVLVFGLTREADEGAAAHTWQLLMGLQMPVIAYFAVKWLPKAFRPALLVLALQAAAVVAAAAPVYLLKM